MNPRQRRGVLLMIVAGLGAIAVFFSVVSYLNAQEAQYRTRTVLQLTRDIPEFQPVTADMVKEVQVPVTYFPEKLYPSSLGEIDVPAGQDLVASTFLDQGATLQKPMVKPSPSLASGEREIAIMVDAETGVAGKISRGSTVDIYATYRGTEENDPSCALRILSKVQVLEIGEIRDETDGKGNASGVVPVTFRLSQGAALQLTYSEQFSGKVRLALVSEEEAEGSEDGPAKFCSDTDPEEFTDDGAAR